MNRSSRRASAVALLAIAYLSLTHESDAAACGSYSETVEETSVHPDAPLEPYVAGHLGVLRASYARRYLVIAYRWLSGFRLSAREQSEALREFERRTGGSTRTAQLPEVDAVEKWREVRARLPSAPQGVDTGRYDAASYEYVSWCLPDAFAHAATTLEGKLAGSADAAATQAWASAQDQVFAHCGAASGAPIPTPLPATAPATQRREREYQIASALFYAQRYPEARAAFEAYGRGGTPDDAAFAKYLVARVQQRAGDLASAERTLRALLADPAMGSRHAAATRYLSFLRVRTAPDAVRAELEQTLASAGEISDLGRVLGDHSALLDRLDGAATNITAGLPREGAAGDGERLRLWLTLMTTAPTDATFAQAHALWQARPDTAWLVAALTHATNARDARVEPLLRAASASDRTQPGYVHVRFHRARLLAGAASSTSRRRAASEAEALRASLVEADGRSAYNSVRNLAARLAPNVDAWARIAATVPAGSTDDGTLVIAASNATPSLAPEAATALAEHIPLRVWAQLSTSSALPRPLVAQLTAAAYVRALLLAQRDVAASLAPRVRTTTPELAAPVDAIERAASDDERALATLAMLLHHPHLAPIARAWGDQPLGPDAIETSYGNYGWCKQEPTPTLPAPAFLSRADRAAATSERAALARLGAAPTYLAREATRLAERLPNDPRVPEALHLAVRLTRYGCRDSANTSASRGAFRALHARYANTEWARRTRHYY